MTRVLAFLYCLLMMASLGGVELTREWQGRLQDEQGEWNALVYKLWDRDDRTQTGYIFIPVDDGDDNPRTYYKFLFTQRQGRTFVGRIWHSFYYQWLDIRYSWLESSDGLRAYFDLTVDISPGNNRRWRGMLHRRW